MGICSHIIADDISASCTNPIFNGLEGVGYIWNKSDIASVTRSGSNDNIITAMTMATGMKGYTISIDGKTPFTGTTTELVEGNVANKFNKTVVIQVMDNGPDVVNKVINELANGEFVVLVENKRNNATGDAKFELFGIDKGLHATAITNDKYGEEVDGGWLVTLVEEGTPKAATFFFDTDEATTRTDIAALVH